MTRTAVIEAALRLPQKQRGELLDRLIEKLDGPRDRKTSVQWRRAIEKRAVEVRAGKARSKPLEQVIREVRRKHMP